MLWFAIGAAISLVISVYYVNDVRKRRWNTRVDATFAAVASLLVGLLATILFSVLMSAISDIFVEEKVRDGQRYELVNISGREDASGSFFLIAGNYDEESGYLAYKKAADGGITKVELDADDVVIYEDQETTAYVQEIETYYDSPFVIFGVIDTDVHVHIPEGSVKRSFDLG